MAWVKKQVELDVGIMAGHSSEMDQAANRGVLAVRAAIARHTDTGNYARHLKVVKVPGLLGNGQLVTDRLIVADDPGSASIEYGHLSRVPGARRVKWTPGLHPMREGMRAM